MGQDAGTFTLTNPDLSLVGAAYAAAGTALDAAGPGASDVWFLCLEDFEVVEIGIYVTVTTGADTLAVTFNRRQTAAGADVLLTTLTGPAAAAIAVDRFLVRQVRAAADAWDFDKGDLMHFVVTDAAAAGALGTFYAKCMPKGGKDLGKKVIAGVTTTTDVLSTT
jgi:hypothetical protein